MIRTILVAIAVAIAAATASADVLILANGDEMHGEIIEWTDTSVWIDHPQLGILEITREKLAKSQEKKPRPGLFGSGFLEGWKRSIDVGVTGTEGNSTNLNVTAGMNFEQDDAFTRSLVRGRAFFNRDDDGVTDTNASVELRRDWLFPETRWFFRADSRYQYDRFESWEHRIVLLAGPGYRLVQRERHTLDIQVGPAFTREFGDRDTYLGEAALTLDHHWKVNGRVSMHLDNTVYYDFTSGNNGIRNVTRGELKLDVLEDPAVHLKVGAENEYESNSEAGDEPNDLQYYLSMGLDF